MATEGGLDVAGQKAELETLVQGLQASGIPVSFIVDADTSQLQTYQSCGARWMELHTRRYAEAGWTGPPTESNRDCPSARPA